VEINVHERDGTVVVAVRGDLDWLSVPSLDSELARAWRLGDGVVILDLSGVEFVDSSGVNSLVTAHRRAESEGRRLGIIEGGKIRTLLRRYGLDQLLMVGATLDELLASEPAKPLVDTRPDA
jgi:anti-sigma B factor antagonist